MRHRRPVISLRVWMIVLVAVVLFGIASSVLTLSLFMGGWQFQADRARVSDIRQIIGKNPGVWGDRAWQRHAETRLHALGVEAQIVRLTGTDIGRIAYTTPGAVALLSPLSRGPLRVQTYAVQGPESELVPQNKTLAPTYEKILVRGADGKVAGIVLLWFTAPAPGTPSSWLWPIVAVGAVFLITGVAMWLFGRSVLRPLRALNRAVEGIAGGDLDVHLPASSAREVTEISTAVEGMSAALKESLSRQNQLEEERRLFIGAVAHDLRTPLFMLRGYLKGLQSGVASTPEKRDQYLDICLAKADALEHLVADLFDFTRLEYLDQEPARQALDLGAVLRGAVEGIRPAAEAKRLRLVMEPASGSCPVDGDPHLLARAIDNLLNNALRYTPDEGQIRVGWDCDGKTATFTIADSGPGIADKDLPHIFTPLYRAEESRNRQTGGAGLGLAITDRILRAHGGSITARNGSKGGAVFSGMLPVALRESQAPTALVTTG